MLSAVTLRVEVDDKSMITSSVVSKFAYPVIVTVMSPSKVVWGGMKRVAKHRGQGLIFFLKQLAGLSFSLFSKGTMLLPLVSEIFSLSENPKSLVAMTKGKVLSGAADLMNKSHPLRLNIRVVLGFTSIRCVVLLLSLEKRYRPS